MPEQSGHYSPSRSIAARVLRRATQWRRAAPVLVRADRPILSMTFDDFPQSAATTGADIVEACGGRAGYFACTSMLQPAGSSAEMFRAADVVALQDRGHEIGAHGHRHLDCTKVGQDELLADLERNLAELAAIGVRGKVTSFAYPFGETDFGTKRLLAPCFQTLRGVLPGINLGRADRAQLRAAELTPAQWTHRRAEALIDKAARGQGWLILFTHDVRNDPSPFGIPPDALDALLRRARMAGLRILPPSEAARACGFV